VAAFEAAAVVVARSAGQQPGGGRSTAAHVTHIALHNPCFGYAVPPRRAVDASCNWSTNETAPLECLGLLHKRNYLGVLDACWIFKLTRHGHCIGWQPLRAAQPLFSPTCMSMISWCLMLRLSLVELGGGV